MKVYIAGPITGHPDYKQHFKRMEHRLKNQGHVVLNPAELPVGLEQEEYMKICLAMVDVSDAVLMLKGWEHSAGAIEEYAMADFDGKQILLESEMRFEAR